MSFWAELKRRNVFRVAAAYLVASWLIVQVIGALTEPLGLPESFDTVVVVLLGIGFPIALVIAWIYEVTPEGIRVTPDVTASSPDRRSGRRLNYVIVALLAAAVGLLAFDTLVAPNADIKSTGETTDESEVAPTPLTLAVLPFDDGSQAGDQAYLANGLSREIRSKLSLIEDLNVIGPDTSAVFKEQYSDYRSLREDWNVDYVLTGTVLSADEQLRVGVSLTDAATAVSVYDDNHERMLDDTFLLMDEIAEAVAQAMEITLGVGEVGRRPGMTRNVRAFDEYLQGTNIQLLGAEPARDAIAHFERAVALDETFSQAWLGLYRSSVMLDAFSQQQGGASSALIRADEALNRINELTPGLPELVMTDIMLNPRLDFFELRERFDDFTRSAAEYSYPDAAIAFAEGMFLFVTGRVAESQGPLERAYAIDPLNGPVVTLLTEIYAALGRPEESRALVNSYREQVGFSRAFAPVARATYTALELGDEAVLEDVLANWQSFANAGELSGLINRMGALIDEPQRAIEELDAYFRSEDKNPFWPMHAIPWAAYFGGEDLVLEMLAEGGLWGVTANGWRPLLSDTRKTDGFKELMRTIGLEPFWRETGNWPDYCEPVGLNDFECY